MTGRSTLQLWRERWGKSAESLPDKPYMRGRIRDFLLRLPGWKAWSLPGSMTATGLLCAGCLALICGVVFSFNGQISYAAMILLIAYALRMFEGPLFTLALMGMSVMVSAQYCTWRAAGLLEFRDGVAFAVSFGLFAFELCVALVLLLGWIASLRPAAKEEESGTPAPTAGGRVVSRLQAACAVLHRVLAFYAPLGWGVLLVAPLAYLFHGVRLVPGSMSIWAVYAAPFFGLLALTQSRLTQPGRWGIPRELREWLLSAYMPLATSVAFLKTVAGRPRALLASSPEGRGVLPAMKFGLITLLVAANLCGVVMGLLRLPEANTETMQWVIAYAGWALINATVLISQLAIEQESRQIAAFIGRKQRLPAMIRLPHGRTLTCETLNFPQATLRLQTPVPVPATVGTETVVSVFHGDDAFRLNAEFVETGGLTTHVCLKALEESDYERLCEAVFARDRDWPMWLPGQDADHPLPAWFTRWFTAVPIKALDIATHFTRYFSWQALAGLWSNRK